MADPAKPQSSPSVDTRFKPGQSGNPRGRPKGSKNLRTLVEHELAKRITLTENGKPRQVTKQEVIVQRLVHEAIKGDLKAINMLFHLLPSAPSEPADARTGARTDDASIGVPDREMLRRLKARLDRLVGDPETQ